MLGSDPRESYHEVSVPVPKLCIIQYNASRFLTRVDRTACTLADQGWEVVLIGIRDDETAEVEQRDGYTVKRITIKSRALPRGFGFKFIRFAEGIWRTLVAAYREDADVYDSRDAYPLLVAHIAAALRGAVVVYDSDELNLDRNWAPSRNVVWRWLMLRYEGYFSRRSAAVITSDVGRARVLTERYGVDPVVILNVPDVIEPPARDMEFRHRALGDARYLLIYQGIIVPNRGLDELVDAMRELDDCRLAIVGYGSMRDTIAEKIAGDPLLTRRAELYDAVPFEQLMGYTAAADIGVIPLVGSCLSYRLAAPNKLFEFMVAGLPIVATDLEEMGFYARAERIGTLIPEPVTPSSIAAAVRSLIDGEESLADIGSRVQSAALERYVWRVERPKLLAVYDALPLRRRSSRNREA